jgi:hypothetical protein
MLRIGIVVILSIPINKSQLPFERRASAATIKLRNERIMRISAHLEAEKPEEQHHNAQHARTQFLLACAGCSLNYGD